MLGGRWTLHNVWHIAFEAADGTRSLNANGDCNHGVASYIMFMSAKSPTHVRRSTAQDSCPIERCPQ